MCFTVYKLASVVSLGDNMQGFVKCANTYDKLVLHCYAMKKRKMPNKILEKYKIEQSKNTKQITRNLPNET